MVKKDASKNFMKPEVIKRKKSSIKGCRLLKGHVIAVLLLLCLFNLGITFSRFDSGVPNGVDSPSHLFKGLYLHTYFEHYNQVPTWCSNWYGGIPFLNLYPPLSYYIMFGMGLLGLNIVLAYKVLDSFFYAITPFAIYFLARSFKFSRRISVLASAVFSITPVTIENFIFYDRFTTTMALPFMCFFLGFFYKFLEFNKSRDGVFSILCGTAVFLIHHLTAYATLLICALLILANYLKTRKFEKILRTVAVTFLGIFLLSAFWLIPFVASSNHIVENQFYNRSTLYDYLDFASFNNLLDSFNIFHFIFSIVAIGFSIHSSLVNKNSKSLKIIVVTASMLIAGGFILYAGNFSFAPFLSVIGFSLLIFSFLAMLVKNSYWKINIGLFVSCFWFITFCWLNLGVKAFLFSILPFWQKLDLLRFQNYMVIPIAILTSLFIVKGIDSLNHCRVRRFNNSKIKVIIALLIISSVFWGFYRARLNGFLHVRIEESVPNTNIPESIIEYFASHTESGRILPIKCPNWIFILPIYTGKPIIDGWYPQEKLLQPLLEINDYRINDLICTLVEFDEATQDRIWLNLINNSSELAISWVLIGDENKRYLMSETKFEFNVKIDDFYIYEAIDEVTFFEISPKTAVENIYFTRISPEEIQIEIEEIKEKAQVKIKEAYYPGWHIYVNNSRRKLEMDEKGFIKFSLPKGEAYSIILRYEQDTPILYLVASIITLLTLTAFLIWQDRLLQYLKFKIFKKYKLLLNGRTK